MGKKLLDVSHLSAKEQRNEQKRIDEAKKKKMKAAQKKKCTKRAVGKAAVLSDDQWDLCARLTLHRNAFRTLGTLRTLRTLRALATVVVLVLVVRLVELVPLPIRDDRVADAW